MGYAEKLKRLCAIRGLDQSALAERLGIPKSSMSRIFSGVQEPKLLLAFRLARELGVTLDYLADDALDADPAGHWAVVTEDELTILKLVRRLGHDQSIDRLLGVDRPPGSEANHQGARSDGPRPGSASD
jgi:transcriptional regulator with XRE-family HTH domain